MADANIKAVITAEDRASAVLKGFGNQLQSLAQVAGGLFGVGKVLDFGKQLLEASNESQLALAQLNTVINSTGDVSGVTAKQADALAKSLQQVTTFSDETILKGENLLLTFTNIGGNIFPQATKAVLDMSVALGQDVSNSAIQLGKALQDPILGVTALRRVGVAFNETQRQTIQNLVETGHGLEAQKMILAEVKTEFNDSAVAAATTFGGQLKILQNNLNDVQETMGNVIGRGLQPFVVGINQLVQQHGQLIAAFGLAALAGIGFASVVVAIAGAIALADAAMLPYIAAFIVLAALMGGVVFNAVQKMQKSMGAATNTVVDGSKQMAGQGANNFGATGQAASDLAKKLADIKTQMDQTTADFMQSLATIVHTHQQSVVDIKASIDDETKAFQDSQEKMTRSHEQKTRDLETQIKALQITNSQADQQKINDLRVSLAQENEAYQKDTQNATDAHTAKLTDFQKKLNAETDFLNKHNDDVNAIQNVQMLDEIDKLKQSHARQMAAFDAQTKAAVESANGQIAAANMANVGVSAQTADMQANLKRSYNHMQNDFKLYFIAPVQDAWDKFMAVFGGTFAVIGGALMNTPPGLILKSLSNLVGHNAEGTDYWQGGPTWVGEKGPELVNLPRGASVTPNNRIGASTTNITIQAGAFMGNPADARRYAQLIADAMKDLAGKKNQTAAQMLGGS